MGNETIFANEPEHEPAVSQPLSQQQKKKQGRTAEPVSDKMRRLLVRHPKVLIAGWSLVAVAFLLVVPAAYLCWYFLPPQLWTWAKEAWWHWIPAFFGFLFLFAIPIWVVMGAGSLAGFFADLSLSIEDAAVQEAQKNVLETEHDAIRQLERTDAAGLLPLLKYSRAQLDAYYAVGLNQTRKSFFNAVLAMWLGFILLLVGIALYVGPVDKLGLKPPTQEFKILILSGAAIIEFISALFLWVYRSTTAQLTYYYQRQMHSHTSILCFRMASTMEKAKADETKQNIIEKVLDWTTKPERPPIVGAKGFRSIISSTSPKASPE